MEREPIVGECLVITRNSGSHGMKVGERIVVCNVDDDDNTLQGHSRGSKVAVGWIPWADCEPVTFGWDYARLHLPPELVRILSACDGIETISLNPAIRDLILESLPDWRQRVDDAIDADPELLGGAAGLTDCGPAEALGDGEAMGEYDDPF